MSNIYFVTPVKIRKLVYTCKYCLNDYNYKLTTVNGKKCCNRCMAAIGLKKYIPVKHKLFYVDNKR